MPDEQLNVDPAMVARVAGATLDELIAWSDEFGSASASMALSGEAFGTLAVRGYASTVLENVTGLFDRVAQVLMAVYEVDADKLYQIAFAYQRMAEEGARRVSKLTTESTGGPA